MREEIIAYIDGWNEGKYSATSRDALRGLLGWSRDSGKSLGTMIVEQVESEKSGHNQNMVSFPQSKVRQAFIEVKKGAKPCSTAATIILKSGWDYIDKARLMNKAPSEIKDYLEDIEWGIDFYPEMTESQRNLFKMIMDAYLRSM